MNKTAEFNGELKERISNPFFLSFLIAWLICNWKILVGLFFYNNTELKLDGYNTYIDFISKNLNPLNTIWQPLAIAFAYTFVFPFFRNCILAFNSWTKAWGNTWNLALSKKSKISITKYIQLREVYHSRTTLLQEVLEKESIYIKDFEKEKNKALHLANEKNTVSLELDKWKSMNDVSQINGEWEIHYPINKKSDVYRVRIKGNIMEFFDIPPSNKNEKTTIRSFVRNPQTTNLSFTTLFIGELSKRSYHFFQLDILDDMKLLRGVEDDTIQIEFRKIG